VGHVVVHEAAGHEGHRVGVADIGQELVAQPLALGGAAHQARHIHEIDARGNDLLGAGDLGQRLQARLGHGHVAHIGLDGAERIIGRLGLRRLGQGVEQGGLAHIGQADDRDFQRHQVLKTFGDAVL
jgi:hypothetical protein